ncbi:MAG: kinase [Thermoplasmata archaeon]|nr:MAG: kinase [Thermoplasmata archaeon]
MFVIKIGGSIITDKSKLGVYREYTMDALAEKMQNRKILLVHGAGSFGHILAEKYQLNKGCSSDMQKKGFAETHALVQKLNTLVLNSLHKHSIPAVSIAPHSFIYFNNNKLDLINYDFFESYLEKGFMPVTFGDVVLDKTKGCSICSGDDLVLALAEYFHPSKVIFVIDEDGLYTANPKIDKNAEFIREISSDKLLDLKTTLDNHSDVTSGMEGKIQKIVEISKLNIDTILVNGNKPERLYDVLHERSTICTTVKGC